MTGTQLQGLSNLASYATRAGFQLPMRHNLLINLPYKFISNLNESESQSFIWFCYICRCKTFIWELLHAQRNENRFKCPIKHVDHI